MSKYTVGHLNFKSKTEITSYYKTMLNSYFLGETVSASDFNELFELLRFHHGYDIKVAKGIRNIKVDRMMYNTRCFHIIHDDGSCIDFSYIECIKGIKKNDTTRTTTPVS